MTDQAEYAPPLTRKYTAQLNGAASCELALVKRWFHNVFTGKRFFDQWTTA